MKRKTSSSYGANNNGLRMTSRTFTKIYEFPFKTTVNYFIALCNMIVVILNSTLCRGSPIQKGQSAVGVVACMKQLENHSGFHLQTWMMYRQ
jgi:hypothetical protein